MERPKNQPRLTLVHCDDWEAFYVNGKLVYQHHHVDIIDQLEKLGLVKIDEVWAENDPFLRENARFPDEMRALIPDNDRDLDKVR
jgi:hypothetical protein